MADTSEARVPTNCASNSTTRVEYDAVSNPSQQRSPSSLFLPSFLQAQWHQVHINTPLSSPTANLSGFVTCGSTSSIAHFGSHHHGGHDGKHDFTSAMPKHCLITNSLRWMTKRATDGRGDGSASHSDSESKENGSSSSTPMNQKAMNAILTQLSSPPNLLTLSRIFATPYLSYLLISNHNKSVGARSDVDGMETTTTAAVTSPIPVDVVPSTAADTLSTVTTNLDLSSTPVIALSLFLAMGFTDFLDGYIARTYPSTATVLGTYLDPLADKFLISVMSLTLCHTGVLPEMLVGLWVARDVGILMAVYWLVRRETMRKHSNQGQDGCGNGDSNNIAVMDPQNTPLKVEASFLSKVNTTLQIGLISLGIAGEVPYIDIPPELMNSLIWITAGTTIGSSLGYLDGSALKKSGNK